ncbi:hypothetical protein [Zhongshania marina]|uniref:Uncharacterized protein n=1 Tax=Zhongshania marina TaxID=2304603 RepID=A0A2S4HF88_9GAMM|nr:hypothetical protein [Marortus luteolus]POP52653.1 hypothetical protein C0068_10620 [Marortus luteolus]
MRTTVVNMPETAIQLGRFRTEYDPVEDRLRLIGEPIEKDRNTVSIWLTMRLTARLVPHLAKAVHGPKFRASEHPSALHSFAQSAASSAIQPTTAPIAPAQSGVHFLPESLNITTRNNTLVVDFIDQQQNRIQLPLPNLMIRQWLSILLASFKKANWPLNCFPEWIDPNKITASGNTKAIH